MEGAGTFPGPRARGFMVVGTEWILYLGQNITQNCNYRSLVWLILHQVTFLLLVWNSRNFLTRWARRVGSGNPVTGIPCIGHILWRVSVFLSSIWKLNMSPRVWKLNVSPRDWKLNVSPRVKFNCSSLSMDSFVRLTILTDTAPRALRYSSEQRRYGPCFAFIHKMCSR